MSTIQKMLQKLRRLGTSSAAMVVTFWNRVVHFARRLAGFVGAQWQRFVQLLTRAGDWLKRQWHRTAPARSSLARRLAPVGAFLAPLGPVLDRLIPIATRVRRWFFWPFRMLGRAVAACARAVARILRALVGGLSYRPPRWVTALGDGFRALLRSPRESVAAFLNRHRQAMARSGAILTLGAFAFGGGAVCLMFQSRPIEIGYTVTGPGIPNPARDTGPQPLVVRFGASVAPLEAVGRPVTEGVRLNPPVPGQWFWASDRLLRFEPEQHWPIGQNFTIQFEEELHIDTVALQEYSAGFQIAPLVARVTKIEYHVDYEDPTLKRIHATIQFNYPINPEAFADHVSLEKPGGLLGSESSYEFQVTFNEYNTEAYVVSEIIDIPPETLSLRLTLEAGVVPARAGPGLAQAVQAEVEIPGRNTLFRIASARVTIVRNPDQVLEQVLVVETVGEARSETVLSGMQAYVLPADRPAVAGMNAARNHSWNPEEIGPEVLAASARVNFEVIPADREFSTLHSFRFGAPENRFMYVRIPAGLQNYAGYVLANNFDVTTRIQAFPRQVAIMQQGSVLSLQGERKLSIIASNVRAVRIEVMRVLADEINHLASQTRGNFESPVFSNYNFSSANISERFVEEKLLGEPEPGKMQYLSFDFSRYLARSQQQTGLFFLKITSYDPRPEAEQNREGQRAERPATDQRFILISDLGFIVKEGSAGQQQVFVQSIASGLPRAAVDVQVLGRNGLPIASGRTDATGAAALGTLADFQNEQEPVAFVLRSGTDVSFMPFRRPDRQVNLSRFDIGGARGVDRPESLQAFLFTDRGLYRPGDEMRAGIVVKSGNWNPGITGVPLEASIVDARGLEVYQEKLRVGTAGMNELRYRTDRFAPTGTYQLQLFTVRDNEQRGTLLGSSSFQVEEFQPDRMKVSVSLSREPSVGWTGPEELNGQVRLRHLFGAPAAEHRIRARVVLSPASISAPSLRGFVFHDPDAGTRQFSEELPEALTDAEGEATIELGLDRFEGGTYRLTFYAEGFERTSGRSVAAAKSILISPLNFVIGYRTDANLGFLRRGSVATLRLLAVDRNLTTTAADNLTARIIETRYVSALTKQPDGSFRYSSVLREIEHSNSSLTIPAGGLNYSLPTTNPGSFRLVITNEAGVELHRVPFTVAGAANLAGRLDRETELQIRLNKTDFAPGEEIQISIIAPFTGAGLVTIERDRVYAHRWFQTGTNSTVTSIRVPPDLEGNAYINVAFVRSLTSEEIYTSPLSYGVAPFSVSRDRRSNTVQLETPDVARPGEPFRIRYSTRRPGRIVVYAVDEGILQVAHYETPDPLGWFFRKRALETTTTQILDLILPEYSIVRRVAGIGGGGDAALGLNLNPFRRREQEPVAYWSGILESGPVPREVTYNVPDYFNGSLRVMAVAVSDSALGSNDRAALIRDHFILQPGVPTFVAPGDEFEVSVGVTNNLPGSGQNPLIFLSLEAEGGVTIGGEAERAVRVPEGREQVETFHVFANDAPGVANLRFRAVAGVYQSQQTVGMSVRPIVPYRTTLRGGLIQDDEESLEVSRNMFEEKRTLAVAVSRLPLGLARGLVHFLNEFPYGCTEQLVSQTFPAVVLRGHPELGIVSENVRASVERTISVLRARQNSEGAFGFWAANSYVSSYQTVYALHFLTEAKERGFHVPAEMLDRGFAYLNSLAMDGGAPARDRAYAIYVLTRNGAVAARAISSLKETLRGVDGWEQDLTGVYLAGAYRLLQQDEEAQDLISDFDMGERPSDYSVFYDAGLANAAYVYILGRHFPEMLGEVAGDSLVNLLAPLSEGRYNTINAAHLVLALDSLVRAAETLSESEVSIAEVQQSGERRSPLALRPGLFPVVSFSDRATGIEIRNRSSFPLFYQLIEAGFDRETPSSEVREGIEVTRTYFSEQGSEISEAQPGDNITVRLRLRAHEGRQTNIAVVELLPGGFEPVIQEARDRDGSWRPQHIDVREDRIVLYGTLENSVQEYSYEMRAVNRGRFQIPPPYAESMYDPKIRATRSTPGSFVIRDDE